MRWPTWTLLIAALALLTIVAAMVSRQSSVTPEEFLAAVEKRIEDGRYDREQTLQNLDQVLARAREAGDPDLETRVLLRRGRLLMELGAYDRARTDLLAVAEKRSEDREIDSYLIDLDTRAGDFAAAEVRVRRGLEREPDSLMAWTRLGRLHRLAAERSEETAVDLIARLLAPDELGEARELISRSSALDSADLERPAIAERLRRLLRDEEESLQDILRAADRASVDSAKAREAYARALQCGVDAEPLAGLLELFGRAGRRDLAADLAMASLRYDAMRTDVVVARSLLGSLEELGRYRFASELARQWSLRRVPLDAEFLHMLARIGLAAGRPDLLSDAGTQLRRVGSTDDAYAACFFEGIGLVLAGQDEFGRIYLRQFLASTAPEPVPGARAQAWRAVAKASRVLGEPEFEREAIQGAIELEPDFDGELHLRLAELLMAAPHGGFRVPDRRYAYGMSLLPQRTEELLPRWHEIGRRELASIGFDPEVVRTSLLQARIWTPASDASPYELFRLAEIHAAAGDGARAKAHLDRLLDLVPGFVPALDLALTGARLQTDRKKLLDAVTARIAAAGRSPDTIEVLREVPFDELESSDVHELMRADPEYFGRVAAARTLADSGRPRTALSLLEGMDPTTLGDEARLLAASLALDAGEAARAWTILQPMGRALAALPQSAILGARAASWSHAPGAARGTLAILAQNKRLGRLTRLATARIALRAGDHASARTLLDAIDAIPEARGGDLCIELAIASHLTGDAEGAARSLARAEAFELKGALERAALVIAIHHGRVESWKSFAERAEVKTKDAEPIFGAALLVLQGRTADARAKIAKAAANEKVFDARWALLARALDIDEGRDTEFDPRLGSVAPGAIEGFFDTLPRGPGATAAAGWIAMTACQEGQAIAAADLRVRAGLPGVLAIWPTWLLATLDQRAGDFGAARLEVENVVRLAPDFEPAWTLLERLDPELRFDAAAYGKFRGERLRALGRFEGRTIPDREDRARWHQSRGEHAAAVAEAELEGEPASAELSAIAARSLLELGRPRDAVERLARALQSTPGPLDKAGAIGALLEAIDRAESDPEARLPSDTTSATLRALALSHLDDPRIVLALARIDLELDPRNPALGVRKAIARLETYRGRHRGRPLDHEVLGSAAAWIDFLARLDPKKAIALAREELDLAPGSLATWAASARAHEANGDREEALETLSIAARISEQGEISREILRIRSHADMDAAEIEGIVNAITALEKRAAPEPALRVLAARSFLNLGPRLSEQALQSARTAITDPTATAADRRAGSVLAAIAILARGREAELGEAATLLETARPARPSRMEADFLEALRGIARAKPNP